jgi:hypothetical protein
MPRCVRFGHEDPCADELGPDAALPRYGSAWAPAGAAPIERGHFVDEFDFVVNDYCGDMTVRIAGVFKGRFLVNERGRAKTPYFMESSHGRETNTNVATGKSITVVENGMGRT